MYKSSATINKQETEKSILRLKQSLELLEDPDSWFGLQHQALLEGYDAVLLIWAKILNDIEKGE